MQEVDINPIAPNGEQGLEWEQFTPSETRTDASVPPVVSMPPPIPELETDGSPTTAQASHDIDSAFTPISIFMPSFYTSVFDVDTIDVKNRITWALWPFRRPNKEGHVALEDSEDNTDGQGANSPQPRSFIDGLQGKPDWYGPVWIAATLAFVIGVGSNFVSWLTFSGDDVVSIWHYDFSKLITAAITVYIYLLVAPTIVLFVINYLQLPKPAGFVSLICLWGYSFTPFLVASFLCVFPIKALQWLAIVVAIVANGVFLIQNTFGLIPFDSAPAKVRNIVLFLVFGLATLFGILLKISFF